MVFPPPLRTGGTSGGATSVEVHKHGGVHVRAGAGFEAGSSANDRHLPEPISKAISPVT